MRISVDPGSIDAAAAAWTEQGKLKLTRHFHAPANWPLPRRLGALSKQFADFLLETSLKDDVIAFEKFAKGHNDSGKGKTPPSMLITLGSGRGALMLTAIRWVGWECILEIEKREKKKTAQLYARSIGLNLVDSHTKLINPNDVTEDMVDAAWIGVKAGFDRPTKGE